MKKLFVILLSVLVVFGLFGCSKQEEPVENKVEEPVEGSDVQPDANGKDGEDINLPNPQVEVESLEKLNEMMGFTFEAPETIDVGTKRTYIAYKDLQLAEIDWLDDSDKENIEFYAFARKIPTEAIEEGTTSISGMYADFDSVDEVEGYRLSHFNGLAYMSEWESEGFSYALVMLNGASDEVIVTLSQSIK